MQMRPKREPALAKRFQMCFKIAALILIPFSKPFIVPIHLPFLEYTPAHKNNISLPLLSPLPQEVVKFLLDSCNSLLRKEEDIFGHCTELIEGEAIYQKMRDALL